MRKITYVKSAIPRDTKIFVDGVELISKIDNDAIKAFQINRKKLTPMFQKNILNAFQQKLAKEASQLTMQEINSIVSELNARLDGKIG